MSTTTCSHTDIEHVSRYVTYIKKRLNEAEYYPPVNGYRYMVALALYSKCITTAEATLTLLRAGFNDEAFGMTRTLLDVYITLRYIANKDTDERARKYAEFSSKDATEWNDVVKTYWPHKVQTVPARTLQIAARYRSPHQWSGKSVKEMALEPDTVEIDPKSGQPVVLDFAYRVLFRWTSHYVHPTIGALETHLVQAGRDVFKVHSGVGKNMMHMAAFNVASCLAHTMIFFYRCMQDPQPARIASWSDSLLKHLARCHS